MSSDKQQTNLANKITQVRVTEHQPTTRSDSVCFILKFFRPHLIKVFEPDKYFHSKQFYCCRQKPKQPMQE